MAGFGAKVSQRGFKTLTAADRQLLSNSSWPLLKIAFTGVFSIGNGGGVGCDATNVYFEDVVTGRQILYTHGLGYPPMFWAIGDAINDGIRAIDGGGSVGQHLTFRLYVFRLPLNQTFQAPVIQPSDAAPIVTDPNYGIKVAKDGKNVRSTDYRDYVIHSATKSPLIHAVAIGTPNVGNGFAGTVFTYTHGLGYTPMAFCFIKYGPHAADVGLSTDLWYAKGTPSGADFFPINVGPSNCTSEDTGYNPSSIISTFVVFKDPFDQPVTNVVY